MADAADELYAVWDGKPARAYGGAGDVVAYGPREHGTPGARDVARRRAARLRAGQAAGGHAPRPQHCRLPSGDLVILPAVWLAIPQVCGVLQ